MKNNENSEQKQKNLSRIRVALLIGVFALSIYIFNIPAEKVRGLEAFGYPGVFILSVLANATVLLPAPGLLIVFTFGAVFHPLWVAVAAGLGATVGEISGYLAGFSGQAIIEDMAIYKKLVVWMKKYGGVTILVMAFIPNPFFDLTGIAAGALRLPIWKFLSWAVVGKILKMLLVAYAGAGVSELQWLNIFSP